MTGSPSGVSVQNLSVTYGDRAVIKDLSLEVRGGEFLTLLGPSGCGKSTLLRAIAGLIDSSGGTVTVDGRNVTSLPPEARQLGFVFQSYALFPHLTVFDNIAFGLRVQRLRKTELRERVHEALEATGLEDYASSMPAQLSGGQQQRVAIARVLAMRPSVLLMDEPLSNLDAVLRVRLRDEIRALHDRIGITTLYVTHDQDEALSMSDRIAVMRDGAFAQLASPRDVYERPADEYVCSFVGSSTPLAGNLSTAFRLPNRPDLRPHVRPESVTLMAPGAPAHDAHSATGTLTKQVFLGPITRSTITLGSSALTVTHPSEAAEPWSIGSTVQCVIPKEKILWLF